jgi:hypothetical protein
MKKNHSFDEVKEKAPGFSKYFNQLEKIFFTPVNAHLVETLATTISIDILGRSMDRDVRTFLELPVGENVVRDYFIRTLVLRGLKQALSLDGIKCFILRMEKRLLEQSGIEPTEEFLRKVTAQVVELNWLNNDGEFENDGYFMINTGYDYKVVLETA